MIAITSETQLLKATMCKSVVTDILDIDGSTIKRQARAHRILAMGSEACRLPYRRWLPNAQLSLARNATAAELRVLGLAIATTSGKINTKPFRVHPSSEARLAKLTASHDVSYDRRCRL